MKLLLQSQASLCGCSQKELTDENSRLRRESKLARERSAFLLVLQLPFNTAVLALIARQPPPPPLC